MIPIDGRSRRDLPSNGIVAINTIGACQFMPLLVFIADLEFKHIVDAALNVRLSEIALLSPG